MKERGYSNPVVILLEKVIFLLSAKTNINQKNAFVKTLSFLDYEPKIKAIFRTRISMRKLIDNMRELNIDDFLTYIFSLTKTNRSYYEKNNNIDYLSICEAIESINHVFFSDFNPRFVDITIDYSNDDYSTNITEDIITKIKILSDINLLSLHDVILYPEENDSYYQNYKGEYEPGRSLYDASSGEQCILLSTLSIASSIENNSLILIDEPEISLHPEWQETYIDLLMKIFSTHNGCHFIIATHSPQIVSRLNNNNCYITQTDTGVVTPSSEYIDKSADFQLARLFNTPGKENEYLRRLAVNVLTEISKESYENSVTNVRDINILMGVYPKLESDDTVKSLIELIIKARGTKK